MLHRMKLILILLSMVVFCPVISEAALLQGTVKLSTGTVLSGVVVKAYGIDTGAYASSTTDGSGVYVIDNLPQGKYRLYFDATSTNNGAKWYGSATCGSADSTINLTSTFVADMTFGSLPGAGTGIIKGTVTDYTGMKLSGIVVSVWPSYSYWDITDVNGQYSITLPVGSESVYFNRPDVNPKYLLSEAYDNLSFNNYFTAKSIAVTANSVFVADAVLEPGGSIAGIVKDASGTPISGASVTIYDLNGKALGSASTAQDGTYTYSDLWVGNYKVYFEVPGTQINSWYNQASKESAVAVTVSAGVTTQNINAILAPGTILGTVTDKNNVGIASVKARLIDANLKEIASVATDANGNYKFINLTSGNYKVYYDISNVYDVSTSSYSTRLSEWFNDKDTVSSADWIQVATGGQIVANAVLNYIGSISGTVSSIDKGLLASAYVTAYHAITGEVAGSGTSDSNGFYTINLTIPGGTYKLKFNPPNKSGYIPSWYNDLNNFQTSQAITVPKGSTVTSVNATLKLAGAIAGTVYDATGTPMANVTVSANDPITGFSSSNTTDTSGTYTLYNLPTGNYAVYFSSFPNMKEYYNHKPTSTSSDLVSVVAPSTTSGINATLTPTGSISGKIILFQNSNFTPPLPVTVTVFDSAGNTAGRSIINYSSGSYTYSIPWLASGAYKVRLTYTNTELWYNQATATSTANVLVTSPNDTPNVDFSAGSTISGTVIDSTQCDPTLVTDMSNSICALNVTTNKTTCSYTSNGKYTINNLHPGNYKIFLNSFNNPNVSMKWYGGSDFASATIISTLSTSAVTDINMVLLSSDSLIAGTITGKVNDSNGKPISGNIVAYDANNVIIKSVSTDYMGAYTLAGLPPGTYKLNAVGTRAYHYYGTKESYYSWYDNKPDYVSAAAVTVGANEVIIANFAPPLFAPHSVTVSVDGSGGTISPSGSNVVTPGNSLTVSILPLDGYQISDVKIDGISVGAVSSYTFSSLSNDSTIVASFGPIPHPPAVPIAGIATSISQTGFTVNWAAVTDSTGYYLDVSTNINFSTFVTGYNNKDVSNLTAYVVGNLAAGSVYYYRVRAYNAGGTSANSATQAVALPGSQVIIFASPTAKTYGDTMTLTASGGASGNPIVYSIVSGPGIVGGTNNATLSTTGVGTIVVKASQAGNANFSAAADVTASIIVSPKLLTITANNTSRAYGAVNPATPGFTTSGLVGADNIGTAIYTYASSATATAAMGTTHSITPSSAVFTSGLASNYNISYVSGTLTIAGAALQTITFNPLSTATYGDAAITLSASASSGLPVSFTLVSGPATLNGTTLLITGAGSIVVKATQSGNSNYAAADYVQKTITVNKASASVALAGLTQIYNGSQKNVSVSTSPPGLFYIITYDGNETAPVNAASYSVIATISDSNYNGAASGTLVITNIQADATAPIVSNFTIQSLSNSLTVPILTISATDNIGVTGYFISETGSEPLNNNLGWTATTPTQYVFSSQGEKTLYAFAKDAVGNVSVPLSANVTITMADTTSPTATLFTLPATVTSLTTPISALAATDAVGVTGYLISESSSQPMGNDQRWSTIQPTQYVNLPRFSGQPVKLRG